MNRSRAIQSSIFAQAKSYITRSRTGHHDNTARMAFLLPTILIILFLSLFPLIVSLYLSFAKVAFVKGGVTITFVGTANYHKLFFGSNQRHLLGALGEMSLIGWLICLATTAFMAYWFYRYMTSPKRKLLGVFFRLVAALMTSGLVWLTVSTLSDKGVPGTLVVTLVFVAGGVFFQYTIGLLLALLLVQNLPGKRFFRVVFLLPMMITPVGVGFLFRMMADTSVGPLVPLWVSLGLKDFSWAQTGSGARTAVLVSDIWQWTPFMFIILLAALEGVSREQIEAGLVDGATRLSLFRYIILPEIAPVSLTLILIRLIEAFKIIDLPRILTGGGPGTATESLTLNAFNEWRTLNLGGSAALGYVLLIIVTFVAVMFVNTVRQKILEWL
ncbi:MAG: sugar ABC transporter permease [Anaerolineae bacterium]